jgi:CubicO group peptidase (beta-lactamase class C family)
MEKYLREGAFPGAAALAAGPGGTEIAAVGEATMGGADMTPDSIFRIASITKPITAAAVLALIDDGVLAFGDPVSRWLPELAAPSVVRTPTSPVDDVVPAERPITVEDLLVSRAGYGFASDFSLPAVQALFAVQRDGREVASFPPPDVWLAELARVPMAYQPGEAFLYDTCSTLQGILVARASEQSFPDFLAERFFGPLGMTDTAFEVPAAKRERFTSYYRRTDDGFELADAPDGQWSTLPPHPLGNGGLASTARDWLAFGRMLLSGGDAPGGRVLSASSVRRMTTDHTTPAQRKIGELFLDGQGWGYGGAVDIAATGPWTVPGRYGWVGGSGTTAHVIPSAGTVAIMLTQVGADSPVTPEWMRAFWQYSATV